MSYSNLISMVQIIAEKTMARHVLIPALLHVTR